MYSTKEYERVIMFTERKDRQFDNFVVTDGTASCLNDNLQYRQGRQSCQIDNLLFSVLLLKGRAD